MVNPTLTWIVFQKQDDDILKDDFILDNEFSATMWCVTAYILQADLGLNFHFATLAKPTNLSEF